MILESSITFRRLTRPMTHSPTYYGEHDIVDIDRLEGAAFAGQIAAPMSSILRSA